MKRKILSGKGKEYGKVSRETEADFTNWLQASYLSENVCMYLVDSEEFALKFQKDSEKAIASLYRKNVLVGLPVYDREDVPIGLPFIWQKESDIKFESYKVDLGLLLMLIESKCKNEKSKKKIKDFIRKELKVK